MCSLNAFHLCITYIVLSFFQPNIETEDDITPLLSAVAACSLPCLELLIQVLHSPHFVSAFLFENCLKITAETLK